GEGGGRGREGGEAAAGAEGLIGERRPAVGAVRRRPPGEDRRDEGRAGTCDVVGQGRAVGQRNRQDADRSKSQSAHESTPCSIPPPATAPSDTARLAGHACVN